MDILTTDLHRICHMISLAADSGGICNIDNAHANFAVVCHRADSTANLGELCRSSYDLPDSTIPVLPSYELRSFLVLRTQAHDMQYQRDWCQQDKTVPNRGQRPLKRSRIGVEGKHPLDI